jgi:hypothetical protein
MTGLKVKPCPSCTKDVSLSDGPKNKGVLALRETFLVVFQLLGVFTFHEWKSSLYQWKRITADIVLLYTGHEKRYDQYWKYCQLCFDVISKLSDRTFWTEIFSCLIYLRWNSALFATAVTMWYSNCCTHLYRLLAPKWETVRAEQSAAWKERSAGRSPQCARQVHRWCNRRNHEASRIFFFLGVKCQWVGRWELV